MKKWGVKEFKNLAGIATLIILALVIGGVGYFVWDIFLRKPAVELLKITGCEYKWETTDWNKTYKSLFIYCEARVTKKLNPDKHGAFIRLDKVYDGNKVISSHELIGELTAHLDTDTTESQNIKLSARGINLTSDIIGVDLVWYIWKYHYFSEDELLATGEYHKTNISVIRELPTHVLTLTSEPIKGIPFTIDETTISTPWTQRLPAVNYTITMPATYTEPSTGLRYTFQEWEDGSTNPARTITLDRDLTLIATYTPPPTGTVSFNITFRRVIIEESWNTGDIYLFLDDKEIENYTVPTFTFYYGYNVDSPHALMLKNTGPSSLYAALVPYEVPKGVEFKMYVIYADRWEEEFVGERQYVRVMYSGGTVTFYLRMRITEPLEFDAYDIKLDLVIAYFESTIQKVIGG